MRKKVVFVIGTGHSGSTLVDLILGSHSHAFSLGELASVPKRILRQKSVSFCRVCSDTCPVWGAPALQSLLESYFSWEESQNWFLSTLNGHWGSVRKNIYSNLFQLLNSEVLIDSSKSPSWARRQLRPFWFWRNIDAFLVYVCRDGRGVVSSYLRKYPSRDIADVAKQWAKVAKSSEKFFHSFPADHRIKIHYEEMALDPAKAVASLCRKIGLEYEPEMLEYWKHDHHIMEGNWGTISLIKKYRQQIQQAAVQDQQGIIKSRNAIFYDSLGLKIQPDLRWKDELTSEQLATFDSIAGKQNQSYVCDLTKLSNKQQVE